MDEIRQNTAATKTATFIGESLFRKLIIIVPLKFVLCVLASLVKTKPLRQSSGSRPYFRQCISHNILIIKKNNLIYIDLISIIFYRKSDRDGTFY